MVYSAIVSDWNGTLFQYPADDVQNKKLAVAASINDVLYLRLGSFYRLLKTKKRLHLMLEEYRAGKRPLQDLYDVFNREVLAGRSPEFVHRVIDQYARESADKVDGRVLRPIRSEKSRGKTTAILSVSYDRSILKILERAGFSDVFGPGDVVANTLKLDGDGKVEGLTLGIYGKKPEIMEAEFFRGRGLRPETTVYLDDTADGEGVAQMLPEGNFIVPFLASETSPDFAQRMASRHGAFVPASEEDLARYLKSR